MQCLSILADLKLGFFTCLKMNWVLVFIIRSFRFYTGENRGGGEKKLIMIWSRLMPAWGEFRFAALLLQVSNEELISRPNDWLQPMLFF